MLPFENRPWARPLAGLVIAASLVAAGCGAWYLETLEQLHISEITGIVLLLLTIIPPNVAVLLKRPDGETEEQTGSGQPRPVGSAAPHPR